MSDAKKRAALPDGRRAEFPKEELETGTFIAPRTSYGCPFKCRHGGIHWSALAVACPYIQYPDDERRAPARVRERQMNAMRMGGATRDINAVAGGRRIRRSRSRAGRFPASRRTAAPSEVQGGALGRACLLH